jgi:hypothetical protein
MDKPSTTTSRIYSRFEHNPGSFSGRSESLPGARVARRRPRSWRAAPPRGAARSPARRRGRTAEGPPSLGLRRVRRASPAASTRALTGHSHGSLALDLAQVSRTMSAHTRPSWNPRCESIPVGPPQSATRTTSGGGRRATTAMPFGTAAPVTGLTVTGHGPEPPSSYPNVTRTSPLRRLGPLLGITPTVPAAGDSTIFFSLTQDDDRLLSATWSPTVT